MACHGQATVIFFPPGGQKVFPVFLSISPSIPWWNEGPAGPLRSNISRWSGVRSKWLMMISLITKCWVWGILHLWTNPWIFRAISSCQGALLEAQWLGGTAQIQTFGEHSVLVRGSRICTHIVCQSIHLYPYLHIYIYLILSPSPSLPDYCTLHVVRRYCRICCLENGFRPKHPTGLGELADVPLKRWNQWQLRSGNPNFYIVGFFGELICKWVVYCQVIHIDIYIYIYYHIIIYNH